MANEFVAVRDAARGLQWAIFAHAWEFGEQLGYSHESKIYLAHQLAKEFGQSMRNWWLL